MGLFRRKLPTINTMHLPSSLLLIVIFCLVSLCVAAPFSTMDSDAEHIHAFNGFYGNPILQTLWLWFLGSWIDGIWEEDDCGNQTQLLLWGIFLLIGQKLSLIDQIIKLYDYTNLQSKDPSTIGHFQQLFFHYRGSEPASLCPKWFCKG